LSAGVLAPLPVAAAVAWCSLVSDCCFVGSQPPLLQEMSDSQPFFLALSSVVDLLVLVLAGAFASELRASASGAVAGWWVGVFSTLRAFSRSWGLISLICPDPGS
jgi:hypothetical protein